MHINHSPLDLAQNTEIELVHKLFGTSKSLQWSDLKFVLATGVNESCLQAYVVEAIHDRETEDTHVVKGAPLEDLSFSRQQSACAVYVHTHDVLYMYTTFYILCMYHLYMYVCYVYVHLHVNVHCIYTPCTRHVHVYLVHVYI